MICIRALQNMSNILQHIIIYEPLFKGREYDLFINYFVNM